MGIGLWASQVNNGQWLIFTKAKTAGLMSSTYALQVDPSWLPPGSKVTFNWILDRAPGNP
jgi:hypothetical protein